MFAELAITSNFTFLTGASHPEEYMDGEGIVEPAALLPEMTEGEQVVEDYVAMRLTLRSHPVALLRHLLTQNWQMRLNVP